MQKTSTATSTLHKTLRPGSDLLTFLMIAITVFVGASYIALQQKPRPNPYSKPTIWENFYYPQEKNAFMRLPVITGDLNDIFVSATGKKVWAVGNNGLIIYSEDQGNNWQQQTFPGLLSNTSLKQNNPRTQLFNLPQEITFSLFSAAYAEKIDDTRPSTAQNANSTTESEEAKIERELRESFFDQAQEEEPPIQEEEAATRVPTQEIVSPLPQPNLNHIYFINDETGFIVGNRGTLLKTDNGGKNWQVVNTQTTNDLNSIIESNNGTSIWAVGNRGIILNSQDGGLTWDINFPESSRRIFENLNDITFSNNGQLAWIVGENGVIWHSKNGGQNWQRQESGTNIKLNAITMSSDERGWIVGNNGYILSSKDSGNTWQPQISGTNVPLKGIVFSSNEKEGWISGGSIEKGLVIHTNNAGISWQPQEINSGQLSAIALDRQKLWVVGNSGSILSSDQNSFVWYTHTSGRAQYLSNVIFSDNGHAWAVGGDGLLLSSKNSGKDWEAQIIDSAAALWSIHFSKDGKLGKIYGRHLLSNKNGVLLTSEDGGNRWESSNTDTHVFYDLFFANDGLQGWGVGYNGIIASTADGGKTWSPEQRLSSSPYDFYAINFVDKGQKGWISGSEGSIFSTQNNGTQWLQQESQTENNLHDIRFTEDALQGWVVGDNGTIIKSTDGGKRWQAQQSDSSASLRAINITANNIWVSGDNGTLLNSVDGGNHWQQNTINTRALLRAISFSNSQRQQGIVVGNQNTILYTHDGGTNWQRPQYARTPALWYWLLCAGLLMMAIWLATKKPVASSQPQETVADLLASDKPLEPGDPDPLNFNAIALGLSRFMRNPATEPPLTVAITGPWGSGKSSMMNLLYHDLKQYGFTPVWFNAWHHQKGEQLLASLYANIKEQAIPSWFKCYKLIPVGLIFRLNLLSKRIRNHWLITLVSITLSILIIQFMLQTGFSWSDLSPQKLLNDFLGKANGSLENLLILILGGPIAILIRALQAFGISPEKLMTNRSDGKQNTSKVDPSARQAFAKEFQLVSSCLDTGRMVIFIDDLDRCSKENVVDILEAMNFLSVSGNCYIVVGMDETWVKVCIEKQFPDMAAKSYQTENSTSQKGFADHYLEKMINIPVSIPTLNQEDTMELLLPNKKVNNASPFSECCKGISRFVQRYRAIVYLTLFTAATALITTLIPKNLFLEPSEKTTPLQTLVTWENVTIEDITVKDNLPNLHIRTESFQQPGLFDTDAKQKKWDLVLEGQAEQLKSGIKIASLGEGKNKANLILKEKSNTVNTQQKQELRYQSRSAPVEKDNMTQSEFFNGSQDNDNYDYWLPVVSFLILLFGLIIYSLKTPNRFVEDSPQFKRALEIWHPWISIQRNTPRAIKRYLNFVRYLAMRYKNSEPEKSFIEQIKTQLSNKQAIAADTTTAINEQNIVALSSIYAIEPQWLRDMSKRAKLKSGLIREMLEEKYGKSKKIVDSEGMSELINLLSQSIKEHQKVFNHTEIDTFSDEIVEEFLEIHNDTKFN